MTTIRGNKPIECTFRPEVTHSSHGQHVLIKSGGWICQQKFTVWGSLSPECARNLIIELRQALRAIRDETTQRLNRAVTEAEKPL